MNNNDYCAFREIKENPVVLDFSGCKYLGEIHLLLKEKFGFPEYYGENWDALWDCMRYLFDERKIFVELYCFKSLDKDLHNECKKMIEVFDDVHRETPSFSYKIVS